MEKLSFGLPKVETFIEGDEVIVKVWISGFSKKDFEIEVKADSLKIEIGKDFEKEDEADGFFEKEWESSSFHGKVSLPCEVVPMIPEYSYDGNVLEVKMKKA